MTDKQNKQEQINRLVKKYPWKESEELFRAELEQLVEQTRQEAVREIIDAYKKNTGIDDDLFTQFLEVMYDYNLELSLQDKQDEYSI